jgi:hypothetical protein
MLDHLFHMCITRVKENYCDTPFAVLMMEPGPTRVGLARRENTASSFLPILETELQSQIFISSFPFPSTTVFFWQYLLTKEYILDTCSTLLMIPAINNLHSLLDSVCFSSSAFAPAGTSTCPGAASCHHLLFVQLR